MVVINGRDAARLKAAQDLIEEATGHRPDTVVADISTVEGRASLIAACPDADILVTNNGGPAPGRFDDWDEAAWHGAIDANMLAPAMMIRALLPGMRRRRFGRIVNITSAMVKSPTSSMGLSTASRAGLTALVKALSREAAKDNVTINNLLPERVETDRLRYMTEQLAAHRKISFEEARAEMARPIAARRFGLPEEFGDACAFLCSAQAGYISGQNLQFDGGSYAGLI